MAGGGCWVAGGWLVVEYRSFIFDREMDNFCRQTPVNTIENQLDSVKRRFTLEEGRVVLLDIQQPKTGTANRKIHQRTRG